MLRPRALFVALALAALALPLDGAAASPALVASGRGFVTGSADPCAFPVVRTVDQAVVLALVETGPRRWQAELESAGVRPACIRESCWLFGDPEMGWIADSCLLSSVLSLSLSPVADGASRLRVEWAVDGGFPYAFEARMAFVSAPF